MRPGAVRSAVAADGEEARRDALGEEREVFRAHQLGHVGDAVGARDALGKRLHVARLLDVVRRHRVAPEVLERVGRARALADAAQHALDALGHLRAHAGVEGPHGAEQAYAAGDHVVRRAAVDRADRHDGRLDRIDVA